MPNDGTQVFFPGRHYKDVEFEAYSVDSLLPTVVTSKDKHDLNIGIDLHRVHNLA
jgi:hypothetical protein